MQKTPEQIIRELTDKIKELELQLQKAKDNAWYGLKREEKTEIFEERAQNALPLLKEEKDLFIHNNADLDHLIIEGDNYHILSVLNYTHKGKIDVIYIDPPYNTGNKDFVYNDNYVDSEDSYRHSKWLSFMNKRLRLAKDLLSDEGVIFISIDENELAQLKLLCDEIFGEKNFVDCISWDKKSSAKWVPPINMIVNVHEYILVYQKSQIFSFIWEKRDLDWFSNPDNDPRWPWRNTNIKSTIKKQEEAFEITDPKTWISYSDTWAFSKTELERLIQEEYLLFPKNWYGQVRRKEFFNEFKNANIPIKSSWWLFDNQKNTEMLKSMFWWFIFSNPKPINLLTYLLKVTANKNCIILDFFAGSGTTGHAVLELNKQDWGSRQFILCSNAEATEVEPEKNICRNITYERVKRVMQGYTNAKGDVIQWLWGGNLRYYTTEFIKKEKSTDDLRQKFIYLCDELLCIKEDTFTVLDSDYCSDQLKCYYKNDHYTVILYDLWQMDKLQQLIAGLNGQISLYLFSLSKDAYEEELLVFRDKVKIENVPDDILETYHKIF